MHQKISNTVQETKLNISLQTLLRIHDLFSDANECARNHKYSFWRDTLLIISRELDSKMRKVKSEIEREISLKNNCFSFKMSSLKNNIQRNDFVTSLDKWERHLRYVMDAHGMSLPEKQDLLEPDYEWD